jgi:uncharacterized protein (TIGR03382 family)
MSTGLKPLVLMLGATASTALGQVFTIWAEAPDAVNLGETYTVEFWGSVEGDPWVDGQSAVAGFGIDAIGSGDVVGVSPATIADWAVLLGSAGNVLGSHVHDIMGGQLPNIFWINPDINMNNPVSLFTIEVTAANAPGSITYTPSNPNEIGGLSFYPSSDDGAAIIAPNAPGTTLVLTGVTTAIIPAPATLAFVGLAGLVAGRRRRMNLKTNDSNHGAKTHAVIPVLTIQEGEK